MIQRAPREWACELRKREPNDDAPGLVVSTFRLSKGKDAMLVIFGQAADGKISALGITADRDYE